MNGIAETVPRSILTIYGAQRRLSSMEREKLKRYRKLSVGISTSAHTFPLPNQKL